MTLTQVNDHGNDCGNHGVNDEPRSPRGRIRRTALILAAIAVAFYIGFILMGVFGA